MFCPKCQAEYVPGVTRCFDCDVELVDKLPRPRRQRHYVKPPDPPRSKLPPLGHLELLTVLATNDSGLIAVAKSLLQAAGIEYNVLNENIKFFAMGRLAGSGDIVMGGMQIQVRAEDADDARRLLAELHAN